MASWCFQIAGSRPSLGYRKQKGNPQNSPLCYFLGHKVPMTVHLLLSTFQSFLTLFYVKDPGFSVALSSRKRGKYVYWIYLETEPFPRIHFSFFFFGCSGSSLEHMGLFVAVCGLSLVAAIRDYILVYHRTQDSHRVGFFYCGAPVSPALTGRS